jgi:uncharacterized protein (DUF2147 family)
VPDEANGGSRFLKYLSMALTTFTFCKNSWVLRSFAVVLALCLTSFNSMPPSKMLVGTWESQEKNLRMEMYEEHGRFSGRMVWFKCSSEEIMQTSRDTENPDKRLKGRKLLGLTLVTQLVYEGDYTWSSGKIYDPNSGNTYEARITLKSSNTATVRGYWKFKWLGRSMTFHRI